MAEEIIAEEIQTPDPALEVIPPITQSEPGVSDPEVAKKEAHLQNLNAAIREESEKLKKIRNTIRTEVPPAKPVEPPKPEAIPEIDDSDPSARAWNQRIQTTVDPIAAELEAGKAEVREYAIRQFLADKPSLSKNPEAVRELITTYGKIRTATERTTEGVLTDLKKAYAALHADELLAEARGQRMASAQAEALHSDIAVSRGATSYQQPKNARPTLTEDDKQTIIKMYGSVEAYWATVDSVAKQDK